LSIKGFLERPAGVAFWAMMLLCFVFMIHSYAITHTVDWLLPFVVIMAGLIFRVAWGIFAWHRPLSVEIEKVERIAFWTTILLSLGLFTLEYLANTHFNYYLFYVFIAGLLTYFVAHLLRTIRESRFVKRS